MRSIPLFRCFTCLFFSLSTSSLGQDQPEADVDVDSKIRIGVVYIGSKTGDSVLQAAKSALADHALRERNSVFQAAMSALGGHFFYRRNSVLQAVKSALADHVLCKCIEIVPLAYPQESEGAKLLEEHVLQNPENLKLIIGPTNSGPILSLVERHPDYGESKVPIVSSLVTSGPEVTEASWFFTTAVSDTRKAQTLSYFIAKKRIQSCAVLYEDSRFGKNAEFRFREQVPTTRLKHYRPYQIDSNLEEFHNDVIDDLLRFKPEAIGVFASAERIKEITNALKGRKKSIFSYNPYLFTSVDMRSEQEGIEEIYYLTQLPAENLAPENDKIPSESSDVAKNPAPKSDEEPSELNDVEALSYNTMLIVLNAIKDTHAKGSDFDALAFRKGFLDYLKEIRSLPEGAGAYFRFRNLKNVKEPRIVVGRSDGSTESVVFFEPEDHAGFGGFFASVGHRIGNKVELTHRRYGFLVYINLLIVAILTWGISSYELINSIKWRYSKVVMQPYAMLYSVLQVLLICSLWLFLADTEAIAYDSVLAAILVGTAPNTLLSSAFFESSLGKAIGLQTVYKRITNAIKSRLDDNKYRKQNPKINVIAFYNTLRTLTESQKKYAQRKQDAVYKDSRDDDLNIDQELEKRETLLQKKRFLAKWLLYRCGWKSLRDEHNLVKGEFAQMAERDIIDPEKIFLKADEHINKDGERIKAFKLFFRNSLPVIRQRQSEDELPEVLAEFRDSKSTRERIRFLVTYLRLTPSALVEMDFLPENWASHALSPTVWLKPRHRVVSLIDAVEEEVAETSSELGSIDEEKFFDELKAKQASVSKSEEPKQETARKARPNEVSP